MITAPGAPLSGLAVPLSTPPSPSPNHHTAAAQAIEDGAEPRDVWHALCFDFDVPRDQW